MRLSASVINKYKQILIVFFIFFLTVFFCSNFLLGKKTFITRGDSFDQSFMWLNKVFNSIKGNHLVFWDFTTQSGISFIGELQTSAIYPVALFIGKFLSQNILETFLTFHFFLASLGCYCLCKLLKFDSVSSLVASILFAYSGSFPSRVLGQPNLFCSVAYIPIIVAGFIYTFKSFNKKSFMLGSILTGAGIAMSYLAGHTYPPIMAITISFVGIIFYRLINSRSNKNYFLKIKNFYWIITPFVIAILISLPQIIAMIEYMILSYKWYGSGFTSFPHNVPINEIRSSGISIDDLKSFYIDKKVSAQDGGTLYIGLLPVFIFILSLPFWFKRKESNDFKIFITLIFCLFIALFFSMGYGFFYIPLLDSIRCASRWIFIVSLIASLLIGLSLKNILIILFEIFPNKFFIKFFSILLLICTIFFSNERFHLQIEQPILSNNKAVSIIHSDLVNFLYEKLSNDRFLYRFYADREAFPPNLGNYNFILSAHGYRSSRTKIYHDYFDWNPLGEKVRKFSIKYWISKVKIDGLNAIWNQGLYYIYELPNSLPILYTHKNGAFIPCEIENVIWSDNSVKFFLKKQISGTLIFPQPYYPGFLAFSNKDFYGVYKFENEFMAIDIPDKIDTISFKYKPIWLDFSLFVSVVTCFILTLIVFKKR